ncbi:MAG: NADH-quinone oxidoreductase subunit C [Thermodesulfobacteriota bacterium]
MTQEPPVPPSEAQTAVAAEVEQSHPALRALRERHADAILSTHAFRGDATAIVKREALLDVCRTLRDDPELAFDFLSDVTAVDYIGRVPRFEVVYHLYSIAKNHRVRIKVPLEEGDPKLPSVVSLWRGADWLERETWDMYGIRFEGHPELKRIYLYEEFEGHPLRKDYPKEKRQPLIGPGAVRHDPGNDDLGI